ncbi:MAG: magnesium transporter [Desulfosarcina sp.]|nr:magnesium transporter [Desulfobacterales bacterium]
MKSFATENINGELIENIRGFIYRNNSEALAKIMDELQPADVADIIEHLTPNERFFIFNIMETKRAGDVLIEIESPVQKQILGGLDNRLVSEIVQEVDSDEAADIIGNLPDRRAKDVIKTLGEDLSEQIEKLLQYAKDTAGGIMDLEFISVLKDATVGDVITIIRENKKKVENFYHVWIVDSLERLVGVVSLKDLIIEAPDRKISEIMNPEVISVDVHRDQEDVARLFERYDLVNMPVVDANYLLVGRITHDDIIDVIEEEVDEDLSLMTGTIGQEIAEESTLKISKARLPWLIAGVFGGIVAAAVINQFETSLERVIALSFFFPVIMAIGGNTGTQAATIVVRGMATGDIRLVNIRKRLWLEMKVAFVNGIICGILLGLIVGFWLSDYGLGAVVALAGVLIILNAGFIGSAVPFVLRKLNIDPALATGPFITTLNDILGLFIYLGLITLFLRMYT